MIFGNNKTCPFCRKKIDKNSAKCKFCNRILIETYGNKVPVNKEKKNFFVTIKNFRRKVKVDISIFAHENKSKIETIFIIILILALAIYGATRNSHTDSTSNLVSNPCYTTKYFSIGTIDPRFNISKETVINLANASVDKWNNVIGKDLLKYSENSNFVVNFVFDYRQENINKLKSIKLDLDEMDSEINSDERNFESDLNSYNQDVEYWNNNGGADWSTQIDLSQRKDVLNNQLNDLNFRKNIYNNKISEYKSQISLYKNVEIIGLHKKTESKETITIFAFNDTSSLTSTITHEFGHSLGLEDDRTIDQNSIMYYIQSSEEITNTNLQPADISAIKTRCNKI